VSEICELITPEEKKKTKNKIDAVSREFMISLVDMAHFKCCSIMQPFLFQLFLCTLQLLKFNAWNSLGTFTFINKAFYVLTENPRIRRNHLHADNSCYSIKTLIGTP